MIPLIPFSICRYCYDEIKFQLAFRSICGHFFHKKCASKYLDDETANCPACNEVLYSDKFSPYYMTIRHRKLQLPQSQLCSIPENSVLEIVKENQTLVEKYHARVKSTYPTKILKRISSKEICEQAFVFMSNIFEDLKVKEYEKALENAIYAGWFFLYLQQQPTSSLRMKKFAKEEMEIACKLVNVIKNEYLKDKL